MLHTLNYNSFLLLDRKRIQDSYIWLVKCHQYQKKKKGFIAFICWSLTWNRGPRRQLVLGVMRMLVWLSGMWDGRGLGQDSGSVQALQSRQAGSWRAGGGTRLLRRPDTSNGRIGLQDQSGQGLSQVTSSSSILHIWNSSFTSDFSSGVLLLFLQSSSLSVLETAKTTSQVLVCDQQFCPLILSIWPVGNYDFEPLKI